MRQLPTRCGFCPALGRLGRNVEGARLLLEHGAPSMPPARRVAPIHAAAQNGDRAMVELLLKYGADPRFPTTKAKLQPASRAKRAAPTSWR